MRIAEFAEKVGENARQIRYLVAEGLIPPPDGTTSAATYGARHEEAVRRYREMRASGLRPFDVKSALLAAKRPQGLDVEILSGVRLVLDPSVIGWKNPDPAEIAEMVRQQVQQWVQARNDTVQPLAEPIKETTDAV